MIKEQVNLEQLAEIAVKAALEAGRAILEVYETENFDVDFKADNSPLTKADQLSHNAIVKALQETGLPVLSEEGKTIDFETRSQWPYFWMIDPLDGTKEFIKRNGEFTVNIALINHGKPILGVVHTPVRHETFTGIAGKGAYKQDATGRHEIKTSGRKENEAALTVVASRSHMSPETEAFINNLHDPKLVSMGSSLKILLLSDGSADVYPRFAPTMEWDTAAAHAVLSAAGGRILQHGTDKELAYNKQDLLNPWFLALAY